MQCNAVFKTHFRCFEHNTVHVFTLVQQQQQQQQQMLLLLLLYSTIHTPRYLATFYVTSFY